MDQWILFVGYEVSEEIKFTATDEKEAVSHSEEIIKKKWSERQKEFPYTKQHPPKAKLFRIFREWE